MPGALKALLFQIKTTAILKKHPCPFSDGQKKGQSNEVVQPRPHNISPVVF